LGVEGVAPVGPREHHSQDVSVAFSAQPAHGSSLGAD
jgi:hypothetical protein